MGCRMKDRRLELKMSQEELSEKSGVSRQTISSIENNPGYNVSSKTLAALAKALDSTVADIFFAGTV